MNIPVIPSYTAYEKMNILRSEARLRRLKLLYKLMENDIEYVEINFKVEPIGRVIKRTQRQSCLPELNKALGLY